LGNEFEDAGSGALRVLAEAFVCAEHGVFVLTRVKTTLSIRHAARAL
jgi:hypothetical protein